jgi:RNA polymerase sigma factor (sigma-70 family)
MAVSSDRRVVDAEDVLLGIVRENAGELLRFARRFSLSGDDAQDAYQRALEIMVRRLRRGPLDNPLSYLRTVIRHEAGRVRSERERLLGRDALDVEREHDEVVIDPAEHVERFERLAHTAEALRRLKPQELQALSLRAEGLSYREICARLSWTYTRCNRAITEGRRALLSRLEAIESGAECERWLPLLSTLADGEATAVELAELRPHLRACPGCRATLRCFHEAPGQLRALVPPELVLAAGGTAAAAGADGGVWRHAEALVHGALERLSIGALRLHGAIEALPGAKVAAVAAASTVAVAGGGAAIHHAAVAHGGRHPPRAVARAGGAAADTHPVGFPLAPGGLSTPPLSRTPSGSGHASGSTASSPTPARGPEWKAARAAAEWVAARAHSAAAAGEFGRGDRSGPASHGASPEFRAGASAAAGGVTSSSASATATAPTPAADRAAPRPSSPQPQPAQPAPAVPSAAPAPAAHSAPAPPTPEYRLDHPAEFGGH